MREEGGMRRMGMDEDTDPGLHLIQVLYSHFHFYVLPSLLLMYSYIQEN